MPDNPYMKLALIPGTYDVYESGKLTTNCQSRIVFVLSYSQLKELPDYAPGTFAATFGLDQIWQKTPAGAWQEI